MNFAAVTMTDEHEAALTAVLNLLDEVYEITDETPAPGGNYFTLLNLRNLYRAAKHTGHVDERGDIHLVH